MTNSMEYFITVKVPINIAVIKYWGKKCEKEMLPMNDSISLTINNLYATTKVCFGGDSDIVFINGKKYDVKVGSRYEKVFGEVRRLMKEYGNKYNNQKINDLLMKKFHINSTTNFPVAAGLASSAAGFGAIAYSMGQFFNFSIDDITYLARIGSGSATRSVLPGLVIWKGDDKGECKTLFPENYWPELRAIIAIVEDKEKEISSSVGMKKTIETSELYKYRVTNCVKKHVKELIEAYEEKNFHKFGEIVMKDSNQFHAVCLDTTPPLKYMNDISWKLINLANIFNKDKIKVAYTFDAGPNCCYYIEKDNVDNFMFLLEKEGFSLNSGNLILSTVGGGPEIISK
ncbi:Diphosphomevalonate decarboxylase [Strongyloides ratti]|uniref:Diphosphomevalonate decarboxylase n=1 Tax=Strongyloides ratti TaxID=34506 RepID=A0A090L763_STRRB|nr:Diphosphomevalonate decarboxylase [Strongyloides ratti]CEF63968.1 Diphosphomevalonate decarboxylase [Strongyloides ratti]